MRVEHLWQSLDRHPFFLGGAIGMTAISGIDQALHDIRGKELGVPLHVLLGGPVRDRLRMYDHLGGGDPQGRLRRGHAGGVHRACPSKHS